MGFHAEKNWRQIYFFPTHLQDILLSPLKYQKAYSLYPIYHFGKLIPNPDE